MLSISAMSEQGWRARIEEAVKSDGRSLRDISMGAGLSHGYLHGILRDGKEPTLDRFVKICSELDLSLAYVLLGLDLSPATQEIIEMIQGDKARRDAILALQSKYAFRPQTCS